MTAYNQPKFMLAYLLDSMQCQQQLYCTSIQQWQSEHYNCRSNETMFPWISFLKLYKLNFLHC